jgi:hypothetical protein
MNVPLSTLDDARALIRARSSVLDPKSRYISELAAIVDASADLRDLERRLDAGCRGRLFAGDETWGRMSLAEKVGVNLVTNETELMRFEAAEMAYLKETVLPWLRETPARIASIPCSHGLEPVSLAVEALDSGLGFFHVAGFDIQRACIETAMTGRIPIAGLPRYVVAHVDPKVMNHLSFFQLDALKDPIPGRFDLVVCRNFLGYFKPEIGRAVVEKLVAVTNRRGCLLVERFITRKHPELFEGLGLERAGDLPFFWIG